MPKKKPAAPHALITSPLGLESAINLHVESSLSLLRRRAKQAKALAEMKAGHAEENRELESKVVGLETGIQLYCTTHRAELFPDEEKAKSRTIGNATVGFRLNPFKVDKLLANDTFTAIAERLEAADWGGAFVGWTLELKKDELLDHRADLTGAQLQQVGIQFTQGETFFLEPDTDLLEAARKPVAESGVAA